MVHDRLHELPRLLEQQVAQSNVHCHSATNPYLVPTVVDQERIKFVGIRPVSLRLRKPAPGHVTESIHVGKRQRLHNRGYLVPLGTTCETQYRTVLGKNIGYPRPHCRPLLVHAVVKQFARQLQAVVSPRFVDHRLAVKVNAGKAPIGGEPHIGRRTFGHRHVQSSGVVDKVVKELGFGFGETYRGEQGQAYLL